MDVYVYVPDTYNNTSVNALGQIHGGALPGPPDAAAKIAYLLENYGIGGQGDQAIALQASIWTVEGFGVLGNGASTAQKGYYQTYMDKVTASGGDAESIKDFAWMSPGKAGSDTIYQGLVTRVPDGGMTLMLLGGAMVGLAALRRRFRA
jgi:hypothetical protein